MKRRNLGIALLIVCGMALSGIGQVPPPDTGKMSWDLFQAVSEMEHRSATGQEVEAITAFFLAREPLTSDQAQALSELGYSLVGSYGRFALVSAPGTLYSDPQRGVGKLDFVANATLPPACISSDYHTEGVKAMGADAAHQLGHTGQGTKIAIIDGGFDSENAILQEISPHYCKVRPDAENPGRYFADEDEVAANEPHGTSCAIIAADVAPEAELYLLSFEPESSLIGWLFAIHYAAVQLDVDVISSSVEFLYPTCHADGTGPLNSDVETILAGTDAIMVLASGNWAMGSGADRTVYGGEFSDSDGDFAHDFAPESADAWDRNGLRFHARQDDRIAIVLEWDDWDRELGRVDLDLIVSYDEYEHKVSGAQAQQLERSGIPAEILSTTIPYTGYYSLSVEDRAAKWHDRAVCSVSFHINLRNQTHPFEFVEHHTPGESVREVATSSTVLSVGAVSLQDETQLPYSSRGPTSDGRSKPDLCGPSGVTGTCYDVFHGTSAAAPYVAAAFAVLKSAFPEMSADELQQHMIDTAACSIDGHGNRICVVNLEAALTGGGEEP